MELVFSEYKKTQRKHGMIDWQEFQYFRTMAWLKICWRSCYSDFGFVFSSQKISENICILIGWAAIPYFQNDDLLSVGSNSRWRSGYSDLELVLSSFVSNYSVLGLAFNLYSVIKKIAKNLLLIDNRKSIFSKL